MKKWLWLFVALLVFTGCSPNSDYEWYTVERVVDGDTFVLTTGERVRLIGVDTPETVKPGTEVQPYGKEASDFTKEKLTGQKVRLEFDVAETDRYGRLLAYVYLEDGTFYNELLLREGYAQVMTVPPNVKYADHFLKVQQEAREAGRGLWGIADDNHIKDKGEIDAAQEESEDLNKLYVDESGQGLIKGNINSKGEKIYHMPGGASYDATKPEVWFKTEQEAIDAGFRKAKR